MFHFDTNQYRRLNTLVENKTVFQSNLSELNIFETFKVAEKVNLEFQYPVVVSMLQGKKVMHLMDEPEFDFYPGQSLVMPVNEEMIIDFPEANFTHPTRCLALGIDPKVITDITAEYRELITIENDITPTISADSNPTSLKENNEIQHLINRLMMTFMKNSKSRDLLVNIMLKELIIRLLQSEARNVIVNSGSEHRNNNRISFAINYIKERLHEKISIEEVANKVYMSVSNFHKVFRDTMGQSPNNYIIEQRIRFSKKLMETSEMGIAEIALQAGFNDAGYFTRQFKKFEGISPRKYVQRIKKSL